MNPKLIEGYFCYYGNKGSSGKGGCGFYINDSVNQTPRKDLDGRHESESCWLEIITGKKCNLIIGVIYRHPSKQDLTFVIEMKNLFNKLKKENNKKFIICGDFNYNLLNYDRDD